MNACPHGIENGDRLPSGIESFLPCDECEEAFFQRITAPVLDLCTSEAMKETMLEAFHAHAGSFGARCGVGDVLTNAHDIQSDNDDDGDLLDLFAWNVLHLDAPVLPDLETVEAMLEAFTAALED